MSFHASQQALRANSALIKCCVALAVSSFLRSSSVGSNQCTSFDRSDGETADAELSSLTGVLSKLWSDWLLLLFPISIILLNGELKGRDFLLRREVFVVLRSEEHTSELQSLMRISYAV